MYTLNKLIFFRLLRSILYTTAGLSFCVWVVQSSKYMKFLNANNITLSEYIHFTSFLFIDIVSLILPISIAVASAFVFHRFRESQQLTVMEALGGSPLYLMKSLLSVAFLAAFYLYLSNFYISPYSWREFRALETKITNNIRPPAKAGVIFKHGDLSIYAQKYRRNKLFENLAIVDNRNSHKKYIYFAKFGMIKNNTLFLKKGERIEVQKGFNKISTVYFKYYRYDLNKILQFIPKAEQANEKFFYELFEDYKEFKRAGESNISADLKESVAMFYQKLISPLWAILCALIAFLFNILSAYKRKMSWSGTFFIVLTVLILQGVFFGVANASAKDLFFAKLNYILIFGALIVTILLILIRNRKK